MTDHGSEVREEWRTVVGYPDYEVSSWGLVRSNKRRAPRILKPGLADGYRQVALYHAGRRKNIMVAHAVAGAFIGPRPDGMETCHNNGVRTDNRVGNLRYATGTKNLADRIAHGTMPQGERHGCAKLTEDQVRFIRSQREAGANGMELARQFKVSHSTIYAIALRRKWAHLE